MHRSFASLLCCSAAAICWQARSVFDRRLWDDYITSFFSHSDDNGGVGDASPAPL